MTAELLQELERLEREVAAPPWRVVEESSRYAMEALTEEDDRMGVAPSPCWGVHDEHGIRVFDDGSSDGEYYQRCSKKTRDLLVALRNAAPAFIAATRALAEIERLAEKWGRDSKGGSLAEEVRAAIAGARR